MLVHKYDAQPASVVDRILRINQFNDGGYYWEIISDYRESYQYGMYYPIGCRLELSIADPSTPLSAPLG